MVTRLAVLNALLFLSLTSTVARAQEGEDDEDTEEDLEEDTSYFPLTLRFSLAPRGGKQNLLSFHALTDFSPQSKVGFSYATGNEALSVFQEEQFMRYYTSDRLAFQTFSVQYQYDLTENFWLGFNAGRFEVHDAVNVIDGFYSLAATHAKGIAVDISKNYLSTSVGCQFKVMPYVSLGFIAFEYVVKGDSSGVYVDAMNQSNPSEQRRIRAAVIEYARKDYFQPPRFMLQMDL